MMLATSSMQVPIPAEWFNIEPPLLKLKLKLKLE